MRRTVQSYGKISPFPFDKSGFASAVNNPFRNYRERVKPDHSKLNRGNWEQLSPV